MSNQSFRWAWCAVIVIFSLVVVQSDADVAESALNDIEHKSTALGGLASIVPHSGLASFIAGYGSATATYDANMEKCRQKKKEASQGQKKCWNKMKAGMNRRQKMRKKSKARLEKVMAQRKEARNRQRKALASRMKVVKAMKTQIKAYKAMAEAPKGGAAELAESQGGSASPDEKKKAAMAEIAKAAAAVAMAEKSDTSASKAADEAQKAQTAAETKMERADIQAQKDETAADTDGSAPAFSFSSRFATEKPASDGLPVLKGNKKACLTQITVVGKKSKKIPDGKRKTSHTCTSCQPDHALILRYHKSMAGTCTQYSGEQFNGCTVVDKDTYTADLTSADTKNVICTKIVTVRQTLAIWNMGRKNDPRRKFFKSVSNGTIENTAFVHCRVWKQTLCMGDMCSVKKEIGCAKVCAADSYSEREGSEMESSCSKDLCNFKDVPLCKETTLIA